MAGDYTGSGSSRGLQVSRCFCETARERYRLAKSVRVQYEYEQAIPVIPENSDGDDQHSDDGEDDTGPDEDLGTTMFSDPIALVDDAQMQATLAEIVNGLDEEDALDDDDEVFVEEDNVSSQSDDEEGSRAPAIARWRLNLTALSRFYNLYIAAYRNHIHISRPRSCVTHKLPSTPDLVLKPEASAKGRSVGGYIDLILPHQPNHLIVADFGEEEILLLAYDDGDIIGYYTRHIEAEIIRREQHPRSTPQDLKPFFHENVGKTAWGIAVHKKSRLIAVGSNTHTATVFIPALTGKPFETLPGDHPHELYRHIKKYDNGRLYSYAPDFNTNRFRNDAIEKEALVRRRDANWRITLETGTAGNNIPNLTFSDDEFGHADKVVAVDISGNLWLMDIWNFQGQPHVRIPGLHSPKHSSGRPYGWGVVVAHEDSFLPTSDMMDSLGLRNEQMRIATNVQVGRWIDISKAKIPKSSIHHPWLRTQPHRVLPAPDQELHATAVYWFSAYRNQTPTWNSLYREGPFSGERNSFTGDLDKLDGLFDEPFPPVKPKLVLKDGSSIMRFYETDIELRSFEEEGVGIMFQHATRQTRPTAEVMDALPILEWARDRLSNIVHVPELCLVVAASMSGRVALITLTRPKGKSLGFKRGFKVEAILPTKNDEDKRLRPMCPLFGVAVAPIPQAGSTGRWNKTVKVPRRYRLMIHYYDHRILSYEIHRDSITDDLSIF